MKREDSLNEDEVGKLLAIEEIKKLKARYFRYFDTKQWEDCRQLFTLDAWYVFESSGSRTEFDSRDSFIENAKTRLGDAITVHHGFMPEIEFDDATHAHGIWAMFDYVDIPGQSCQQGFGHYEETYRDDGQGWRIASLRLSRLRIDVLPTRPERLS